MGRPSIDPELMMRMLIVGYCMGIRSERRLCEEVHLNLAYRWFCRLGLDGKVPGHSTFSKNRHGRSRESDALRRLFESVVQRCMAEGLVGAEAIANAACRHLCRRLRRCRRPPCLVLSDVLRQDTAVNALMGAAPPASAAWRSRWQCR